MRMAVIAQRKMAGPKMASAAKARAPITIARRLKIKSAMVSVSVARARVVTQCHGWRRTQLPHAVSPQTRPVFSRKREKMLVVSAASTTENAFTNLTNIG